jgi:hypothetical protein
MVQGRQASLSPGRLCANRRNEKKSAKGNRQADEKALERNLKPTGFKTPIL